jgi:nucleoside-diphosphate-sugar epimerase
MSIRSRRHGVVVTGAAGFLGGHLVRALLALGVSPVLTEHRRSAAPWAEEAVRRVPLDLACPQDVGAFLRSEKPSILIHLAGTRGRGVANPAEVCNEVNYRATATLLKAALGAGVRRVVLVGSSEEYGPQPGPWREDMPSRPVTAYGVSKAAASRLAHELFTRQRLSVVVVRPFTVYGPGQPADMFLSQAVAAAVGGRSFAMSAGTQQRDLVFVADVVRALLAAATNQNVFGGGFNVASGAPRRLVDVARRVWQLAGATGELRVGAQEAGPAELVDTWADIRRARRLLGWTPQVSLDDGLRATIAWQRTQNLAEQRRVPCLTV